MLLEHIELLLLQRYDRSACEGDVASLAIGFVGKYYSRIRGHSKNGDSLLFSGGEVDIAQEEQRILLDTYRMTRAREIGGEWLCWQAVEELGIRRFLEGTCGWAAPDVDVLLMNLLGRLLYPVSEHKTELWLKETSGGADLLGGTVGLGEDALHRVNVKLLGEHHRLEEHIYNRADELLGFGERRFLYDLTNTYFEGRMLGSGLAQFGRSKEKRSDCRLVSISLLTNDLGFIKRSDFHAGNVSEPATFSDVVALAGGAGILTDAGIGTAANLAQAALQGVPYMCVVREGFAGYQVGFEQAEAFDHEPSNGSSPYKVWVKVVGHAFSAGGKTFADRLIFVKSEMKMNKEVAMLQRQKQRMEQGLETIRAGLSKPKGQKTIKQVNERIGRLKQGNSSVARAFDITLQQGDADISAIHWTYDAAIEKEKGVYVIRTSFEVPSAREGWEMYHTITNIETVNRCCKTDLNIRPVYHQKDQTIKSHLLLTLLACSVVSFIRFKLAKKGINWAWKEVVRVMNTQKAMFSEFKNAQQELILLSQWTYPEPKARSVYQAMNYAEIRNPAFFFKVGFKDP